jgi:ABC-type nitrate/sulfonate/bicarbonate transport system substrate-binding protein
VTLIEPRKILAALLLWSSLSSIDDLFAADLPVVRASYNAIGGVFTPLWLAQENKLFNKYGISVDLKFLPLTRRCRGASLVAPPAP